MPFSTWRWSGTGIWSSQARRKGVDVGERTPEPAAGGDETALKLYEMYVGTAEAVSERRGKTNSFFLAVNSTLITVNSVVLATVEQAFAALFIAAAGIVLCIAWTRLLRSYRALNRAKFSVIQSLEKSFPVAPFTDEWVILSNKDKEKEFVRLSLIEAVVPWVFALFYVAVMLAYVIPRLP